VRYNSARERPRGGEDSISLRRRLVRYRER